MSATEAYRNALRFTRDAGVDAALEMVRGDAPLDATVLLTTLEVVLALDASGESTPAGRRLVALAGPSEVLAAAIEQLDLAPGTVDLDPRADDPEERLHGLAALAALMPTLPLTTRRVVREAVDRNIIFARMEPEAVAPLSHLGAFLSDALGFPESHPATELLEAVADAQHLVLRPWPLEAVERGIERARLRMRPGWSRWLRGTIGELPRRLADWLDGQLAQPTAVFAQASPVVAPQARLRLAGGDDWEVNLVVVDRDVLVEWAGIDRVPPQSAQLIPEGRTLESVAPLVEQSACWRLGETPSGPRASVELLGPDGVETVVLAPGTDDRS